MGKRSREKRERREDGVTFSRVEEVSLLERVSLLIVELGVYLTLFTPFILVKTLFFPYVSPKSIFFRILVDIILIAYIILVICNRKYLPKFNILTIAVIVFLAITVLTSFTGIDFEKSFWSTFERMTGLLTFFHLFAFFIILTSVFKERKYWERILTVSILAGVLVGLYAFFVDDLSTRGGGTVGNVSFLASYLLFNIFFAISLFFVKRGAWKLLYGAAFLLMLLPMFFNVELPRGGIGSLVIGLFLLVLGYMVFSGRKMLRKLAPVVLVLTLLIGFGVSQTTLFKQKVIDIEEIPGPAREIVWKLGYDAWQERFWLGWGQENFNIAFNNNFNSKIPSTGDLWYDRAHNIVLDVAVTSGIFGLLSYLALFVIAIIGALKLCLKITNKRNIFFPLCASIALIAYFIQNIWVFDMISSYLVFFLTLAFIDFLMRHKEESSQSVYLSERTTFRTVVGLVLIIITVFTFYFGNFQVSRASNFIVKGIAYPLEDSITYFKKAFQASSMSMLEAPEQMARKFSNLIYEQNQDPELLKESFDMTAEKLKEAINRGPGDFRLYLVLGRHYNDYFQATQNEEHLKGAEKYLLKAIEVSPNNQQGYWSLGQTKLFQGKNDEAVAALRKSVELDPDFMMSHWYLSNTYKIIGEYELALEEAKAAEEVGLNWRGSFELLRKVIDIQQFLKNDEELIDLYQTAISLAPERPELYAGIAVAYANTGQFDKAREFANFAISLDSDDVDFVSQIEIFLNQLP